MAGIRDWKQKKDVLKELFDSYNDRELARSICGSRGSEAAVESLKGSFKSWDKSNPTGSTGVMFLTELRRELQKMGFSIPINFSAVMIDGAINDFMKLIPKEKLSELSESFSGYVEKLQGHTVAVDDHLHHLWSPRKPFAESSKTGLERGHIDQKLYYLSPDAVETWKSITEAGEYTQYDECKAALKSLVDSPLWKKFSTDEDSCGAVMLGGGAPPKDLIILNSLLEAKSNSTINYAIVDYSYYMLKSAFEMIDLSLRYKYKNRACIELVQCDFMNLGIASTKFRQKNKQVAWILPGGTIGNLNEKRFFQSLSGVVKQGDLLVIGAETISETDNTVDSKLTKKYEIPEVRRLLESPLRSAWHDMNITGSLQDAINRIDTHIVEGSKNDHSTISGSATVVMSLQVERRKVILLTSTRYKKDDFVDFASTYFFTHEETISSPTNNKYVLFVFRFDGPVQS